jgi:uncharacterized protein YecE (DUF72 family)
VFAVKGGRFITHMKKLRDVTGAVANFFASGVLCLGESLGPVLWQFPENMPCDFARWEAFFELLPRDHQAAAELASQHHTRALDPAALRVKARVPMRHAVELRNPECINDAMMKLLRRHGIAFVFADTAGRFPYCEEISADFVYVRLHGDTKLYASGYSARAIARWAERIDAWHHGREPDDAVHFAPAAKRRARDVYVYFDNDGSAHAPHDAMALQAALAPRTKGSRAEPPITRARSARGTRTR